MKKLSKILVMLLAVTLCLSCFAVFAFADDEAEAYDYTQVLEYFESGYFVNADFNAEEGVDYTVENVFADKSDEFSTAFTSVTEGTVEGTGVFSGWTASTMTATPSVHGSFGINARVSLQKGVVTASTLKLQLYEDSAMCPVVFNIAAGKVTVGSWNSQTGEAVSTVYDTSAVAYDTFFTVELFYDASTSVATFTVTPEGSDPEIYSSSLVGVDFSQIRLYCSNITYDYLEMYKGTFPRRLSGNDTKIAEHIDKISELYYTAPDDADSLKYLEVVAAVYMDYGYTTDNVTDTDLKESVDSFAAVALKKIGDVYAKTMVDDAARLEDIDDYNEKLGIVNVLTKYDELLVKVENDYADEIILDTSFEDIAAARAKVAEAADWLAEAKANTETTVAAVALLPDIYFATYKDLREFSDVYEAAPICQSFYDEDTTAEEVAAAYKTAESYMVKYLELDGKASRFIANTVIAADAENSFSERYEAYVIAKANVFTDTTYNDYIEYGTIEEVNATYEAADAYITPIIAFAEDFMDKVDEANSTLSYSVKRVALAEAAEYLATVEQEYPGVTEAIELYNSVNADVEAKIAAAEAYITAVIAVRDAADLNAKIAAIAVANEKAAAGNDVSVDVTVDGVNVTEANILLSNAESEVKLEETRSSKFVTAVAAIENASTMLDKRRAILSASSLKGNADESLDEVVDAIAKLDAAIAAYNSEVASANANLEEGNEIAMTSVKKTVLTKPASEIVAIIKKIFED